MKIRLMFASAMVLAAVHSPSLAQAAPADLVAAYRAGVAAAKCDLGLDSGKSSQLGNALNSAVAWPRTISTRCGAKPRLMPMPITPAFVPRRRLALMA